MSDSPEAKRARCEESLLSAFDKKLLFDEIYKGISMDVEFFEKDSQTLKAENCQFYIYLYKLEAAENKMKRIKLEAAEEAARSEAAEDEIKRIKLGTARSKFFDKYNNGIFDQVILLMICNDLGPLLFDLVEDNFDEVKKVEIIKIIENCLIHDKEISKKVLLMLNLRSNPETVHIPLDSSRKAYAPSLVTGFIQQQAEKDDANLVYPYPFGIQTHFPVFFCHSVFVDFIDILNNRKDSQVVTEYEQFLNNGISNICKCLDDCLSRLIISVLTVKEGRTIDDIVEEVAAALKKLFPGSDVNLQENSSKGAEVFVGNFPFIIVEAKNDAYAIDAVLQGLQYYGLIKMEFIDNDPCFLITLENGIFYLYGVAKVNGRVVSSCLLSLEFTSHFFNINGFSDILYRCFGALRFFYDKFKSRLSDKETDPQHLKYSQIKYAESYKNQPYPAIFSVTKEGSTDEQIEISAFKEIQRNPIIYSRDILPYFRPGVYLVEIKNGQNAVLKLASNYGIEEHGKLAEVGLAPKILGHDLICGRYHIILMEYLSVSEYDTIFNHLHSENSPNLQNLKQSLEQILQTLEELNIVHGDFRSANILAKRSEDDPTILVDFKVVDFEFSGKVDEPYPFLAMRNPEITWPDGFSSYKPRKFSHDQFMLANLILKEFKI